LIKDKGVLENFQSEASKQGKQFADTCLSALRYAGWEIVKEKYEIKKVGIEIDAHAINRQGVSFFFEFKGSLQGERPGSKRTDTLKKAIANGLLFSLSDECQCCAPMILLTSHIPDHGAGLAMLDCLPRTIFFDVLNPWNHGKRLQWIANADEVKLEDDMRSHQLTDLIRSQWCLPASVK
jgi:hypothetical protein